MPRVRLGYFENFKSGNTLLLEADTEGLRAMARMFQAIAAGTLDRLNIHDLPFAEAPHGVQLQAILGVRDCVKRSADLANGFLWVSTMDGWLDTSEKLDVLAEHTDGHQYFGSGENEAIIQVSLAEYDDNWWRQYG